MLEDMKAKVESTATAAQMPDRLGQSAFEMFADYGFANVNLEQIAKNAGVTKGSLYWHYKNKQDLILAACRCYYRQWHSSTQRILAPERDPLKRLQKTLISSVDTCIFDKRNRLFTTAVFMLMQDDEKVRDSWMQFYSTVRELYFGMVLSVETDRDELVIRREVDLMLEAMEGLKLRAGFEPQIAEGTERVAIAESLVGIFRFRSVANGMVKTSKRGIK